VGTTFGSSIYGPVDPFYMIMLIKLLGWNYLVWDKAASVRLRKPGRSTLYARFTLSDRELATIKALAQTVSVDRIYQVDLSDAQGTAHATVEKTIYISLRKDPQSR
jgi:hypothetical protein